MGKHQDFDLDSAKHVLWHFGDENYGVHPGAFEAALILAITRADSENLEKLRGEYPSLVEQVTSVKQWGFDAFRDRVIREARNRELNLEIADIDILLVVGL